MDTKTALGIAGGMALTVVGAVSALVLTLGGGSPIVSGSADQPSQPIVQVVDQYGNPVDLQQPITLPEIVVTSGAPTPETVAGTGDVQLLADAAEYEEADEYEYEEDGYEEHEDEDGYEEHEDEDGYEEHEDEDGYEGHEEDEDDD